MDEAINSVLSKLYVKGTNLNPSNSIRNDIDTALFDLVDVNGKRVRVKAVTTRGSIMFRKKNEKELRICRYKEILRDARIIRVIKVDGEDYVEIVHDALCSVIASRQERVMKEIADNALKEVEEAEKRKRKQFKVRIISALLVVFVFAGAVLWYYQFRPITIEFRLNEASIHNADLPPLKNAIVTLTLDDGDRVATIYSIDKRIDIDDVPIRYIGNQAHIRVECQDYLPVDTTLLLTKDICLNIYRDTAVYGKIAFNLWNPEEERPETNAILEIDGHKMEYSIVEGKYCLNIPLEFQKTKYSIISTIPLENDTILLPCGPEDVILTRPE